MSLRPTRLGSAALACCLLAAAPAAAQYFGRNKVRHERFDFRILETTHFDIYYYPSAREAVARLAPAAERWYDRLSRVFGHTFAERQPLVLYASHPHFQQTNVVSGRPGETTGGLTDGRRRRIVMPIAPALGLAERVLAHELVHAFQFDILRRSGRSLAHLPLWFVEGMAEYLAHGGVDPHTAMWMRDASAGALPAIDELDDRRHFPYRYGQALWAFLVERFGERIVAEALRAPARSAIDRLEAATGLDRRALSQAWHARLRERRPAGAPAAATRVVGRGHGRINLAPALSPDGRRLVFLSERDRLAIDLFLADAATGRILGRLLRTAADPHLDSLQLVESAGAWDPAGRRIAFAAVRRGQAVIRILDAARGRVERDLRAGVDQAFTPAWSPDGSRIVFSGLAGGVSDLYVYDLRTDRVRRLTADAYADLQPAWSPRGDAIAFATDRFTTDSAASRFGELRLASIEPAEGRIEALPHLAGARHTNPQWAPDGASLYLLSDRGGVADVYRLDLAAGSFSQVTTAATGVSGLTPLSPALSVASAAGTMAYVVFARGGFEIHGLEDRAALAGRPLPPESTARARPAAGGGSDAPAVSRRSAVGTMVDSPPAPGRSVPAASALTDDPGCATDANGDRPVRDAAPPDAELPLPREEPVPPLPGSKPYRPRLSFEGIEDPYLMAGGGSYGGVLLAGASFAFADVLGDRRLQAVVRAGSNPANTLARLAYVDRASRWTWSASAGRVPVQLFDGVAVETPAGDVRRTETWRLRQVHHELGLAASYPFSRAERVELASAWRHVGFAREGWAVARSGGRVIDRDRLEAPAGEGIAFVEARAALVHDSAVFGAAGPVAGRRARLEIAPAVGSRSFVSVTADLRGYWSPVRPWTVAARLAHLGRYGPGAADRRLVPLAAGLHSQVRGYDSRPLVFARCRRAGVTACSVLDALAGSRLMVANLELRFAVAGLRSRSFDYGRLPLEGFLFADAGLLQAGTRRAATDGAAGPAIGSMLLRSAGAGVRVNAGGIVFEVAAALTPDRPGRRWALAVNLRPGF